MGWGGVGGGAGLGAPAARLADEWMIAAPPHVIGTEVEAEKHSRSALGPPAMARRMGMIQSGFGHRSRALVGLGRDLWLLGRAEEATRVATQTLRETTASGRPATTASCFVWTSTVFRWCGDLKAAEDIVEALISHGKKHSLGPCDAAVGLGLKGQLSDERGAGGGGGVWGCEWAGREGGSGGGLGAGTTAARMWSRQGRRSEARDVLTGSYRRFTEGFETADLVAAKVLLRELS